MYPIIAHIYGPVAIHSYGFFVALGVIIFAWFTQTDSLRAKTISKDNFFNALFLGIIVGIIGARILFVISNPETMTLFEMIRVWEGGLSFLGAVVAVLIVLPLFLKKIGTPILPFFDLIGLYAPLLYACSRIGCFLAGCCYGLPSALPWAVTFTHPASRAPLCIALHPTQLYSAISALGILFIMHVWLRKYLHKPGQLISSYLMLAAIERFTVDFWRNDRLFSSSTNALLNAFSIDQWVALATLMLAITLLIATSLRK